MRIPEDALYWPFDPRSRQSSAQETGTEPVDNLKASQDALARQRANTERHAAENSASHYHLAQDPLQETEQRQEAEPKERRQRERRKRQQEVLLDTRATPRRRRAVGPAVDVEV